MGLKANDDDTLHHILPGVYVGQAGSDDCLNLTITVYGQPIVSGDRVISLTFTAQ